MDLPKRRQTEANRQGPRRTDTRDKRLHRKIALLKATGMTRQEIYEALVRDLDEELKRV